MAHGSCLMASEAQRPGCRGGSRYVEGGQGLPYLKKLIGWVVSWFLVSLCLVCCLLVSWFERFLVSWFLDCWFLGLKASRSPPQCFWKILVPYYQMFISCFIEIDIISEIFKKLLDRSSSFVCADLFWSFQNCCNPWFRYLQRKLMSWYVSCIV